MEKEIGRQVLALRLPSTKKNYDTMVHNQKQFADMFRKHGCYAWSFQLDSDLWRFYSISNVLSANQNYEVWMDLEFYRDRKHMDEYSLEKRTD